MTATADTAQIRAFAARLGAMPAILRDSIREANVKSANETARTGKRVAPRSPDGPHIGDSIVITSGNPNLMEKVVSIDGAADDYAGPLEWGHVAADGSHVPANPWWIPLARVMNKKHRGRLQRALRKALRVAFP